MYRLFIVIMPFVLMNCTAKQPGVNGENALVSVVPEAPGSNCVDGGQKISSGMDVNGSGVLDASETTVTQYVCNGTSGAVGPEGASGLPGTNGNTTLVAVAAVAPGVNCASGGQYITRGIDANNNGVLDLSEVLSASYICNGASGSHGSNALIASIPEAAGGNCISGGWKITSGTDTNANGLLDPDEIQATNYVCNGSAGSNALVTTRAEVPDANCFFGGHLM